LKLIFGMFWYVFAYKGIQDLGVFVSAPSDPLDVTVVTRGKNDINTVRFLTQTACFVS